MKRTIKVNLGYTVEHQKRGEEIVKDYESKYPKEKVITVKFNARSDKYTIISHDGLMIFVSVLIDNDYIVIGDV